MLHGVAMREPDAWWGSGCRPTCVRSAGPFRCSLKDASDRGEMSSGWSSESRCGVTQALGVHAKCLVGLIARLCLRSPSTDRSTKDLGKTNKALVGLDMLLARAAQRLGGLALRRCQPYKALCDESKARCVSTKGLVETAKELCLDDKGLCLDDEGLCLDDEDLCVRVKALVVDAKGLFLE